MSYYSSVEFTFAETPPDFKAIILRAQPYLEANFEEGSIDDILKDLRRGIRKE